MWRAGTRRGRRGSESHGGTAPSGPPDGVTESRLLAGRVERVGTDAECERRQVGETAYSEVHAATITGQVMEVHDPIQDEVAVGIEAPDQLLTVIVEV